jgi:hypothetical protein
MNSRLLVAGVLAVLGSFSPAMAQQPVRGPAASDNGPRLADIMESIQARHIKLWFAGKTQNWDLAAYEVAQIRARLEDAAVLYPGLPVTDVTTMAQPLHALSDAIDGKNGTRFARAFGELTAGCNSCHQGIGRSFIVIQLPASSPFSDQSFAAPRK